MVTESPDTSVATIHLDLIKELSTAADFLAEALEIIRKHPESEMAYTVLKLPAARLIEIVRRIQETGPR